MNNASPLSPVTSLLHSARWDVLVRTDLVADGLTLASGPVPPLPSYARHLASSTSVQDALDSKQFRDQSYGPSSV